MKALGKKQEALTFARRALEGWRESHPDTKKAKELVEELEESQKAKSGWLDSIRRWWKGE
ncbi:MAG: hypothetical protein HZA91_01700 [Verrucomicrobia bacterium]|nr:hypothetical protein [Verrucomicrobiota bacterium]